MCRDGVHSVSTWSIGVDGVHSVSTSDSNSRLMFWNVENFFDTRDDTLSTGDDEYTPQGRRRWTTKRYTAKRDAIAKTIIALDLPAIVGLAEVENRYVVDDLCRGTLLRSAGYEVLHHDSPDHRGIDCAVIFRPALASLIDCHFIAITHRGRDAHAPSDGLDANAYGRGRDAHAPGGETDSPSPADTLTTREIVAATFRLATGDTLCLFVVHLPSRLGGKDGERNRQLASATLSAAMLSASQWHPQAVVMAVGDFNAASDEVAQFLPDSLFSSMMDTISPHRGTYYFHGAWQTIDHAVVVRSATADSLHADIFAPSFLLEYDRRRLTTHPNRTYRGDYYHGGISDHLPIYCDL